MQNPLVQKRPQRPVNSYAIVVGAKPCFNVSMRQRMFSIQKQVQDLFAAIGVPQIEVF